MYLNQSNWLQCFALENGDTVWERALPNWKYFGYLIAADGYVLSGGWRGYTPLYCLNTSTGEVLWEYPERRVFGLPLSSSSWGFALPNPAEREVLLVDWADGRITRRLPLPEGIQVGEDRTSIQCCDESLLATTKDGEIYLIDPITESRWRKIGACDGGIATITPVILENQLIFQDSMQRVCSYDLVGGILKWSLPLFLGRRADLMPTTMISSGRIVVGGTSSGRLEVIDDDGNRIGAHTVGKRIATDLYIVAPNEIVFGTKGLLVRYRIE